MKRQAILFDLDGTLLPMNLEEFTQAYFRLLSGRFSEYDPETFLSGVWKGTRAMVANDGSMTNEKRFWTVFAEVMGQSVLNREPEFEAFYHTDFHKVRAVCGENPLAKEIVSLAHARAEQVILATNPLFPVCAVESRLNWLGLTSGDFDYITTYDNSSCCKPTAAYYQNICDVNRLDPKNCLMVGNDLREDAKGAAQLGMQTHIVTDSLITHGLDLNDFSHSTFAELPAYL